MEHRRAMFREIRAIKDKTYKDAQPIMQQFGTPVLQPAAAERPKQETRSSAWTFVMKCSRQEGECEGFVGTNWTCGLCSTAYCKDCREPFAADVPHEGHVCNEEKRLTVAALRKEAKPCPKCAAMISKIDGCDQMWCTQCRTAFSWRTGSIEENRVHNPHYFEWMRRNGELAPVPAAGADGACWTPQQVQNHLLRFPTSTARPFETSGWIRVIRHYEWETRRLRRGATDEEEERRVLRVKRLVNELDDTAWKVKLQRSEKARNKRQRVCQVLETFTQAGIDVLRGFLDARSDQGALYTQLRDLETYCNEQLQRIGSRYKSEVPRIVHETFVPPATQLMI
jgi:hypothetical protein